MTAPAEILEEGPALELVTPARKPQGMNRDDWRTIKYAMRRRAQVLSQRGRVTRCGTPLTTRPPALEDRTLFDFPTPPMLADVECYRRGKRAELHGLQTCGSPWECPICAERLGLKNAELLNAAARVTRRRGGGVYTATFTLRHSNTMALRPLLKAKTNAWRKVQAGAPWKRCLARYGILGYVRAPEVTYGEHGFHPHLHVGFYTEKKLTREQLTELQVWLSERWRRILIKQNPDVRVIPSFDRGVKIRALHKDDYLAKFGLGGELAKSFVKRAGGQNRTPWQILYDLTTGHGGPRDRWLWREYAVAMFKVHPLRWSKGLKARLQLEQELEAMRAEDRADRALETEKQLELVLTIDGRTWAQYVQGEQLEADLVARLESAATAEEIREWFAHCTGAPPRPAEKPPGDQLPFDRWEPLAMASGY